MKETYAGGTVTRRHGKWNVFAPDGRRVGTYWKHSNAVAKAQHWDKWDTLDSLHNTCSLLSPYTTNIVDKMLASNDGYTPSKEEIEEAAKYDIIIAVLASIAMLTRVKEEER